VKHELKGVLKCIDAEICTHFPPPPPQTVTDIASNVQLILYCYKMLQENLVGREETQAILSLPLGRLTHILTVISKFSRGVPNVCRGYWAPSNSPPPLVTPYYKRSS
jgi:hypothetical protein